MNDSQAKVGVIMGSSSDFPSLKPCFDILDDCQVPYEKHVVSAHRTPEEMVEYAKTAEGRGLQVIIAAAGGAAHLPGMTASVTILPVIGVPIQSKALSGLDSLLSIVQMPGGIPVLTQAIGEPGAQNAALAAISILALNDSRLKQKLHEHKQKLKQKVRQMDEEINNSRT